MDPNLRRLGIGSAIRTFGAALYNPFLALFLVNVLLVPYVEVGAIIAGIGVVLLPFNILGGLVTDRMPRRTLILLGLSGEVVATTGLAFAFHAQSLVGAIAAALGGGIIVTAAGPAISAYIADLATGAARTRGFTFYRIGFNAGFAAGVALGGVLISLIGFAGSVAVAAGVIAGGTVFLGLTLDPSPRDRRPSGASPAPGPLAPAGAAPGRSMGESFRILARDRLALELLLAVAFAALVVGQWSVTFPLYVHNVAGVPYSLLGVGLSLNGLVVVFGQSPITERAVGHRHTTIAVLGIGMYAAAFLGLGGAGRYGVAAVPAFFAAVFVLTIGENLLSIPQMTLPSNLAPPGEVGSYNGAFGMVGGVGFIASVLFGGAVLSAISDPLLIWAVLLVPGIPSVLLFRDAARRLRPEVDRA